MTVASAPSFSVFGFDVSIQRAKRWRAVPANLFTTGVFLPCKLILHY